MKRALLLLLLVVFGGFGVLGILAADALAECGQDIQAAQNIIGRTASLFVGDIGEELLVLFALPEVQELSAPACDKPFAEWRKNDKRISTGGVIGMDGRIRCSGIPVEQKDVGYRSYFQDALATNDFALGEYQVGVTTGENTVNLGYPLLDNSGTAKGVILAALRVSWLQNFLEESLPANYSAVVLDRTGTFMASHPRFPGSILSAFGMPLGDTILKQRSGTARLEGPDGQERLFVFAPLLDWDTEANAYMAVGIPPSQSNPLAKFMYQYVPFVRPLNGSAIAKVCAE